MRLVRLFIILLLLCVLLCSCKTSDAPTQAISSSVLQVQISINPELLIELDAQGNVCNVTCQNPDAEAVCKDLPHAGIPFDHYFKALLEACVQQGYLKDSAEVSVQVMGSDAPLSDSLRQAVAQQAQDILVDVSQGQSLTFGGTVTVDGQVVFSDVPKTQPPHAQEQYDEQGNLIYYRDLLPDGITADVYLDSNGNKTKEIYTQQDGAYSVTQYNAQGLQELFEDYGPGGVLITRLTRIYHNGDPLHYTETDQNNFSTEYKCASDGTVNYSRYPLSSDTVCEEWYENGVAVKAHWTATDDTGTVTDSYFENSMLVSETRVQPDGVRMEKTYDKGVPVLESWSAPDGEVWEVQYENGVVSKSSGRGGDTVWYKLYSNGVEILHRQDSSDGTYIEERYTESGVLYYHATYHAGLGTGSATTTTFNPNGTKASQFTENVDGSTYEVTFDADGKPVSWREVDANGKVTQGGFDANGNPIGP